MTAQPGLRSPRDPRLRAAFWLVLGLGLALRVWFAGEVVLLRTGREWLRPLDMWLYAAEGRLILDGDLTLSSVPELQASAGTTGVLGILGTAEGRAQLHAAGERPLVDAPAYPYLVAASLATSGSAYPLRVLQIALTLLVAWLTWVLARACGVSERAAWAAMTFVTFHPIALLEAGFLQKTTLLTLLLLGCAVSLALYLRRPGGGRAGAIGAAVGALHLTQGIVPLLLPFLLLGLLLSRADARARLRHAAVAGLAFLVVCTPLLVRAQVCGTSWLHNGQGAWVLAIANFQGADGLHLVQPPVEYTLAMTRGHTGALGVLRAALETHPDLESVARLWLRKLHGFVSGYESWNNLDPARDRHLFASLAWCRLDTWVLTALALLGLPAAARRWRALLPVWSGLLVILAVCLLGFTLSRYRAPALPYLAVLAGVGIERLRAALQVGGRRAGATALVLVALGGLTWPGTIAWTRRPGDPPIEWSLPPHQAHLRLSQLYERQPALRRRLLVRAALAWPVDDRARGEALHAAVAALCREAGDRAALDSLRRSALRLDPSGALTRQLGGD